MKYYAVKIGRVPGIYESLDEANAQITGYKKGHMKSFKTKELAISYLADTNYYVVIKGRVQGIFRSMKYFNEQICGIKNAEFKAFVDGFEAMNYFAENVKSQKYYAIREGVEVGIFVDEKIFTKHTKGYKNVKCKSYATLLEAMLFLTQDDCKKQCDVVENLRKKDETEEMLKNNPDLCIAYVDGAYDDKTQSYSLGVVLFINGKRIEMQQLQNDPNFTKYCNVAGEVMATETAIRKAIEMGAKSILIYHDLVQLSNCLDEQVEVKATIWKSYRKAMKKLSKKISFNFKHVKAHSGVKYNTRADQLAKSAIKNKYRKLHIDVIPC